MLKVKIGKDFCSGYLFGLVMGLSPATVEEVNEKEDCFECVLKCEPEQIENLLNLLKPAIVKGE